MILSSFPIFFFYHHCSLQTITKHCIIYIYFSNIFQKVQVIILRVAIFDFDGTLYSKETYALLMDHLKTHPQYHKRYKRFIRAILPPYIANKMKLYPKLKMRSVSMQMYMDALKGLSVQEIDTYFEEVAGKMQKDFNKEVISRMQQHAKDGIHIMLVSGAYTPLLHLATKELPINQIIGTDVQLYNKKVSSKLPVKHVQGKGKNIEIEAALTAHEIDWENSFAYADSYSDLSVLQLVGHPVAVQPEPKLFNVAQQKNWEII